jgi:hypothetical protein
MISSLRRGARFCRLPKPYPRKGSQCIAQLCSFVCLRLPKAGICKDLLDHVKAFNNYILSH